MSSTAQSINVTQIYSYGGTQPSHYSVPSNVAEGLIFYVAALTTTTVPPDGFPNLVYLGRLKRIPHPGSPGALFSMWASRAIMKSELKAVSNDALQMWQLMWPDNTTGRQRDPIRYGMNWAKGALIDDTVKT